MDYKNIIIIGLVFLMLTVFGILQAFKPSFFKTPTVKINDKTFKLDVAKSEEERQVGLSKHKSISSDRAMLFLFEKEAFYSFWMKDMKFAIDIIYIKGDKIVTIYKDQKPVDSGTPPILTPTEAVDKVLEINAGLSEKYNIKKGDNVVFKNL